MTLQKIEIFLQHTHNFTRKAEGYLYAIQYLRNEEFRKALFQETITTQHRHDDPQMCTHASSKNGCKFNDATDEFFEGFFVF